MSLYVYPQLSNRDYGFVRVGGPGLANCLFVAARAALLARHLNGQAVLLRPTWERFGIGQFLRREKDKRFYAGFFKDESAVAKLKKAAIIRVKARIPEEKASGAESGVIVVSGLRNYFADLWEDADYVRDFILSSIEPSAIAQVPQEMRKSVAIHVRLGDFPQKYRTELCWYESMIEKVSARFAPHTVDFQLFSDGTDAELAPLLRHQGVRRVYYGNALADIIAISRCGFLIGSDSTFSGWGAFLGNVPSVFAHLEWKQLFEDCSRYAVLDQKADIPVCVLNKITK